jgi:hypothetical protein
MQFERKVGQFSARNKSGKEVIIDRIGSFERTQTRRGEVDVALPTEKLVTKENRPITRVSKGVYMTAKDEELTSDDPNCV